ncbi:polysaccharide deacetylase [Isoptericola sp. F-RaC21]|uniref:polysaccharide deacetylase family protein n=1 Tax=Isoptericola sp. F-RaC21 TaxID=3141452 RepID=UPI00315BCFC9
MSAAERYRAALAVTTSTEPWRWEEEVWRPVVEHVPAGRRLVPTVWPGGARVAVAISVDADQETPALRDGNTSPGVLAAGEYGSRVALRRLLRVLDRHAVPASFFVPAVSALLHPDDVRDVAAAGHEVAVHGWIHERNALLERADERDLTLRAIDVLERLAGRRPVGIRTPSWDFSPHTLSVVREAGLLYDSSLMADDDPYELVEDGEPTGVVEVPVEWIRDDAPYFAMARYAALRPHTTPDDVLGIWRAELHGAIAEGGVFQLTVHPSILGHRSRVPVLDRLLAEAAASGPVWFATHEQIARHVAPDLAGRPLADPARSATPTTAPPDTPQETS